MSKIEPKLKRTVKLVSLNRKEMNKLWHPIEKEYNYIGASETIKRAISEALIYNKIKRIFFEIGIDLEKFVGVIEKWGK